MTAADTSFKSNFLQMDFTCILDTCRLKFINLKSYIRHLKQHINDGYTITCPFRGCQSSYQVISSFSSHVSRVHIMSEDVILPESSYNYHMETDNETPISDQLIQSNEMLNLNENAPATSSKTVITPIPNVTILQQKYASLYLRLQHECFVPATSINIIIKEYESLAQYENNARNEQLRMLLYDSDIDFKTVNKVINGITSFISFGEVHRPLSSCYKRQQYYETHFNYVPPVAMIMNATVSGEPKRIFQYVPILQSIQFLFKDPTIRRQFLNPLNTTPGLLKDFHDGLLYQSNKLFRSPTATLQIILYQDAFEIVNPLGSAKRKHKTLAVYFTLGNIYPQNRSQVVPIQLVMLSKEKDVTALTVSNLFKPLVNDLRTLEVQGVDVGFAQPIRGTVAYIAGDNLGSHWLGGFSTNFSTSKHFRRYCLGQKQVLQSDPLHTFEMRTVTLYDAAAKQCSLTAEDNIQGVKFTSVFNELEFYHVCLPGLPPCLGHDMLEGVIQFDMPLFLKYFIRHGWFDVKFLNFKLKRLKLLFLDASTKPPLIPTQCNKLPGNASQNWCFLRFFPITVYSKILNFNDPVWGLVLLLRQIVEMMCAPTIYVADLPFLKTLIEKYLWDRLHLFPSVPLRPKHHYMQHYPGMMMKFGPLIRTWTMRFESKHSYFKNAVRSCGNFINVLKSLACQHQLLQAAKLKSGLIEADFAFEENKSPQFFSNEILKAFNESGVDYRNCTFLEKITLKTLHYNVGHCIVLLKNGCDFIVGVIEQMC